MTDARPPHLKHKEHHGVPVLYRKITARHTAKIVGLLEAHTLPRDEKGYITYETGWSDQRVFDEAFGGDPLYSFAAVEVIRAREFGRLRPPPKAPAMSQLLKRIKNVEASLAALDDKLAELSQQFNDTQIVLHGLIKQVQGDEADAPVYTAKERHQ